MRLHDLQWSRALLRRDDGRYRRSHGFIGVAGSVITRRLFLCQARTLLQRPYQTRRANAACAVNAAGLRAVLDVLDEGATTVRAALQSTRVAPHVKELLLFLKQTERAVQGMDGHRELLRLRVDGMRVARNQPTFFCTVNPADTRHPIMLHLADPALVDAICRGAAVDARAALDLLAGGDKALPMPAAAGLQRLVAEDPVAAVEFFYVLLRMVLRDLLGADAADLGTRLPPDGCAASGRGGALGELDAFMAVTECQGHQGTVAGVSRALRGHAARTRSNCRPRNFTRRI